MEQKASPLMYLRAAIYYVGFYAVTIVYSSLCLLASPLLSYRGRFKMVTGINFFYIFWLRVCCGVKV